MLPLLSLNLTALLSLLPAALILPLRPRPARDVLFWLLLALAIAGPAAWAVRQLADSWNASLPATLWVGIAASAALFAAVALLDPQAWRLSPLLLPYLLVLGGFATVFSLLERRGNVAVPSAPWLATHIVVSVITVGLLTLAAVAALSSFLQVRTLKVKRPTRLSRMLPAVADSERLSERLLLISEAVLAVGLVTGMALERHETGSLLRMDHKTMLSLLAFAVIGVLLVGRRACGVRGQIAARVVLLAYLLLLLGYFGVKFVRQIGMG